MKESLKIKSMFDGFELSVTKYEQHRPKANVLICHGMCEHQLRYEDFANFLVLNGYRVFTFDMRGHGESKGEELGYFSEDNLNCLVEDMKSICSYLKTEYSDLLYVFAHSMGSVICRNFLMENSQMVDKVILSGAPNPNKLAGFGYKLASYFSNKNGAKNRTALLHNLSVGGFNKKVKHPVTNSDWISYNEANVRKYNDDPLCNFTFTNNGFKTLFYLVKRMHQVKEYKNVKSKLQIVFLWGKDDPVMGGNKGLKDSVSDLKKAGFINVSYKEFEQMRHEILNESFKHLVYDEVKAIFDNNWSYCPICSHKLTFKEVKNEGLVKYCPHCDSLFFSTFNTAVSMIVRYEDEVLLIKQYKMPKHVLVAGYVKKGESLETTCYRELKEETNLEASSIKMLKSEYFSKSNTLIINCLVDVSSKDFTLNDEVEEASWFKIDEAANMFKADSLAKEFYDYFLTIKDNL